MAPVKKWQIQSLHIITNKMSMSDERYRRFLAAFGAGSSKDLTEDQASALIKVLIEVAAWFGITLGPPGAAGKQKRFDDLGRRPGMATPAQLRKIEASWVAVSRQDTFSDKQAALNHFLSSRFGVSRVEWVTAEMVAKVLAAISAMASQETPDEPQAA